MPDGQPWWFVDYFSGERFLVSPAIVHAMRSKEALAALGQSAGSPEGIEAAEPAGAGAESGLALPPEVRL
ncbi:MAG: hypothetical protein FJ387_28115 [Verrucomicrobia bacterium]|nr:hypothetical protein [Verrucomicrobiota bacterium]